MYLVSLLMENFRQHKETYLQFTRGVTGILGANGAGKSTILEAIAWALYGNQHGVLRGNKESLIWRQAPGKSEAIVTLIFVFNNKTYTVKRSQGINRSTAQLWQDTVLLANALKAVDEQLANLLNMTHQEFFNSYFTGQKDLFFLGSIKGATDRERFIARMLGYEKITEIQGAANKEQTLRYDLRHKQREKDKLEGSISNYQGITDRVADQQIILQKSQQSLIGVELTLKQTLEAKQTFELQLIASNNLHSQYLHLKATLTSYQSRSAPLSKEIEALQSRCTTLRNSLGEYEILQKEVASYSNLQAEYQQLSTRQQELLRIQNMQANQSKLQKEIVELQTEINNLATIEADIESQKITISQLQNQLQTIEVSWQAQTKTWQESQAQIRAAITFQKQSLHKTQSQHQSILGAGEAGVCPTCERTLKEEYAAVVDRFKRQITQIQQHILTEESQEKLLRQTPTTIKTLETNRLTCHQELQAAQQKQIAMNKLLARYQFLTDHCQLKQTEHQQLTKQLSMLDLNFDHDRFGVLQKQLHELQPKYEAFLRTCQTPEQYAAAIQQLQNKQEEQAQLQANLTKIEQQLLTLNFREEDFMQLKQKVTLAQQKYETAQQSHRSIAQQVAIETNTLQQLQQQEQEYQAKEQDLKTIRSQCLVLEELDNAFTDLRQFLTEQIRPQLAQSASIFLTQLTEGRYTELDIDDRYQVIVKENNEPKPIISGGEEDIVNLALRLAISQMITQRSGQPFSLLVLDEIFGSLDEAHRDHVIQLLHSLEQQFEQVLLITHIEGIKESLNQSIRLAFDPEMQCSCLI